MTKPIEAILARKLEARPRIYAYSIANDSHSSSRSVSLLANRRSIDGSTPGPLLAAFLHRKVWKWFE